MYKPAMTKPLIYFMKIIWHCSFKQEEGALGEIIHGNVNCSELVKTGELQIYDKNKKLKHV